LLLARRVDRRALVSVELASEPCGTAIGGAFGRLLLGCVGWPVHLTGQGRVLGAWALWGDVCGRISAPALRGTVRHGRGRNDRRRASARATAAAAGPTSDPAGRWPAREASPEERSAHLLASCGGSMHDVDAIGFAARPRGACAGRCWPIDKGANIRRLRRWSRPRREVSTGQGLQVV